MPVFRDHEGNHYDISSEDLARYKVSGDLPEGAKLGGVQTESGGGPGRIDPGAARYYWPPIELLQSVVANLVNAAHNYPGTLQGGARQAYFWDSPGARPQQAAAYNYASGAAYNYASGGSGGAAYNYAGNSGVGGAAYNYAGSGGGGGAAYNYAGSGGGAAYNYERNR